MPMESTLTIERPSTANAAVGLIDQCWCDVRAALYDSGADRLRVVLPADRIVHVAGVHMTMQ